MRDMLLRSSPSEKKTLERHTLTEGFSAHHTYAGGYLKTIEERWSSAAEGCETRKQDEK